MSMKTLLAMGVALALLSACGGGGGGGINSIPVTEAVPAAASTDPVAATSYVSELTAVPESTTDTLEPVAVPEMLASSETAEPAAVP